MKNYYSLIGSFVVLFSFVAKSYGAEREKLQLQWGLFCNPKGKNQKSPLYCHKYIKVEELTEKRIGLALFEGNSNEELSCSAVNYVNKELFKIFEKKIGKNQSMLTALKDTYKDLNENFMQEDNDNSGTTATVAIFDGKNKKVYLANAGNSQAVLVCSNEIVYTKKHDFFDSNEKERAQKENSKKENSEKENNKKELMGGDTKISLQSFDRMKIKPASITLNFVTTSRGIGYNENKSVIISDPDCIEKDIKEGDIIILKSSNLIHILNDVALSDSIVYERKDTNCCEFVQNTLSCFVPSSNSTPGKSESLNYLAKLGVNIAQQS